MKNTVSDSRSAWTHEGTKNENPVYWPNLVQKDDASFGDASIFLGGYYTEIDSGNYSIRDASNELFTSLTIRLDPAEVPVLAKRDIVFVTHSTGGIVVRHLLVKNSAAFKNKNVGLVLIASPSVGSRDAARLEWLAKLAKQHMGSELQWNHPFLVELDKDFKNLVDRRTIPSLVGIEAIENHFIVKGWILSRDVLVEPESAGRYFGEPIRLPNTDHFSAVKPDTVQHSAHKLLRSFYENKFVPNLKSVPDPQLSLQASDLERQIVDHLNNPAFCRDALNKAKELISIRPDHKVAYKYKGRAYYCLGLHRDAISAFDEALTVDPDYRDALFNKAVNLGQIGAYGESVEIYRDLLSKDQSDMPTRFNLSLMEAMASNYDAAIVNGRIVKRERGKVKDTFALIMYNLLLDPTTQSRDKALEIAEEIGYEKPNYFCLFFGRAPQGLSKRDYANFEEFLKRIRESKQDHYDFLKQAFSKYIGDNKC